MQKIEYVEKSGRNFPFVYTYCDKRRKRCVWRCLRLISTKTMGYRKPSETSEMPFLRLSYAFPTPALLRRVGVGNVGNTYMFPTFLRPDAAPSYDGVF